MIPGTPPVPPAVTKLFPIPFEVDRSGWQITVPPAVEPVTLEEVMEFTKIDDPSETGLMLAMIKASREAMERYLGRALIKQTVLVQMDQWPGQVCKLPYGQLLQSGGTSGVMGINQIRTLDEAGGIQVYDPVSYYAVSQPFLSQIIIKNGYMYPFNTSRWYKGYEVEYLAGYGTTAANVPEPIKMAIKLWLSYFYEQRVWEPLQIPPEALALVSPYRVIRL